MSNAPAIARKEKQLQQLEEKMRNMTDDVRAKTRSLLSEKEMDRNDRLARVRHQTHFLTTQMDLSLRPPDQSNDIRTYSKMDLDIWKYEDVRNWFNKDAVGDPDDYAYRLTPAQTGYVVRVDEES